MPATLRGSHSLAWSLLGADYDVRFLDAFGSMQPGQCPPQRLAPSDLAGVDVLVVGDRDGTLAAARRTAAGGFPM